MQIYWLLLTDVRERFRHKLEFPCFHSHSKNDWPTGDLLILLLTVWLPGFTDLFILSPKCYQESSLD